MDFYSYLKENNLENMLHNVEYVQPSFFGWEKVKNFLLDLVNCNKKVFIYGDYDVDGLMCALCIHDGLKGLGVDDVSIYNYRKRTHDIDPVAVQQCIQGHYDYFIVCDTGSSDLGFLKSISKFGTKIIVLDHHTSELNYEDYGDQIAVINTVMENKLVTDNNSEWIQSDIKEFDKYNLSAGALCYSVMDLLYSEFDKMCNPHLAVYATISLFADCVGMQKSLNRAIYYRAYSLDRDELPRRVSLLMNEYSAFNARFIGYWFSPRINALFRAENFDVLNAYFFSNSRDSEQLGRCIASINTIYESSRALVAKVVDVLTSTGVETYKNFVLGDLTQVNDYISVYDNKLYNYTGLVANMLAKRYQKTAVTYCIFEDCYKGSVRDHYGRAYLPIFKQLCYAGGHGAAFGINVNLLEFNNFKSSILRVDERFAINAVGNEPIIIQIDSLMPDAAFIEDVVRYNEFSGTGLPIVLLEKQIIGDIRERRTAYNWKYTWGDYLIQSDYQLEFGKRVLLKPTRTKTTKLFVQ